MQGDEKLSSRWDGYSDEFGRTIPEEEWPMMSPVVELPYWGILLAVFARQLCLPVPALLFLMTAGALAAQGRLHLSLVLLIGVLGCLGGDGVWFWFGRRWGIRIVRVVCRLTSDPQGCTKQAHRIFDKWGLRVLIVAKFIPGLDGVTPPLAGAEGSSIPHFLAYDAIGAFLWSGGYTMVGFIFANQLDAAVHGAERFGKAVVTAVAIPVLYTSYRCVIIVRMMARLRLRRMSPALLNCKLQDGEKVAVIDLLSFEDVEEDQVGIPGSVRMDPNRLRTAPIIAVPEDVELVLYCSSQREIVSARVAIALRRRGITKVWVLEGGLAAWIRLGLPVTQSLSTSEEVASRLGIQIAIPKPLEAKAS
jgi:membrane protein DedA with SNARE-associated domain/rhodanese-related sulfurtransferase